MKKEPFGSVFKPDDPIDCLNTTNASNSEPISSELDAHTNRKMNQTAKTIKNPQRPSWLRRYVERHASFVLNHPWLVITLAAVMVALLGSGARHLQFANNYRVFFSGENPELLAFDEFQDTYTKNDNIMFVVQPADGEALSPVNAVTVEALTKKAWQIPYAIRVDSITNFQHTWANGDDLTVEDLIADAESLSTDELAEKRSIALAEPLLRGNLISPDARTVGVNVTLQYPEKSITEVPESANAARAIAAEIQEEHPDMRIALTGLAMMNAAFAESAQQDMGTLIPVMYAVLLLIMALSLRSVSGTVATLIVIVFSTIAAVGFAGYRGIDLDPISAAAPTIILTLAIADSIHVLISVRKAMQSGLSKIEAIRESLRINFVPVSITSVTTMVGFLALNFSDSPPFWYLGNITSFGIATAWILSLTLLPSLVRLLPFKVKALAGAGASESRRGLMDRWADYVIAHRRSVLLGAGAFSLLLISFVPRIELNDEWVKYFDHRVPFRNDAEFGMDNLTGVYLVEYSLESGESQGMNDPVYLNTLEKFTSWLRSQPEVDHVYSYADVMKRLNKNMHGDDESYYRIPEDRELAAQYTLLYELSLPYGLDLNDRVSVDKASTRVTVTMPEISTARVREFIDRSQEWLSGNAPPEISAKATGATVMFAHIAKRNIENMLTGNAIAVLLISVVMVIALRSFGLGMLSLIPNTMPILITFGIWGIFVGQIGLAAATVTATSLGIIVDDSVHFLAKYLYARREKEASQADAVRYAFNTVGPALVATTIILTLGFAVLTYSTFLINSQMGLLTAIAILTGFVFDFTILPALLLGRFQPQTQSKPKTNKKMKKRNYLTTATTPSRAALYLIAGFALFFSLSAKTLVADVGLTGNKGYDVAARSDRSDRGFADSEVALKMILKTRSGKSTERDLRITTLEVPDESLGDKSLVVFSSPRDIDGTALLSHAHILDPDDQWLFLPALKRTKRISSVNKSGPFVGSEFAFEDFTALELNKYDYRYLREEVYDGRGTDVIELRPKYQHSGYTRQIAWIDQKHFQFRKIEFYDRKNALLKTLELKNYKRYQKKYWRPHLLAMTNHQTGKSTDLVYGNFRFGAGLGNGNFVKSVLARTQ